jgi:hypothetical protein
MMDVTYKCACMSKEATVVVPDRHPKGDLMEWMELVQHCIGVDHRARSPICVATAMEYAKIPFDEAAPGLGMKATKQ